VWQSIEEGWEYVCGPEPSPAAVHGEGVTARMAGCQEGATSRSARGRGWGHAAAPAKPVPWREVAAGA